jgi:hypothetical protein
VTDTDASGSEYRVPVHFVNENTGFVTMYRSWKTVDGGQTLSQGGICTGSTSTTATGVKASPSIKSQFRTFDITGSEPTDRTTEGSAVSAADPLNFGSVAQGADSQVRCITFRITSFGSYTTVFNMKFYLADKTVFMSATTTYHADITDTWTQNKTPAQVKAGTPGTCPVTLPGSPNLTKIGGGDITGVGHADTSQYIYLVLHIGNDEELGAGKEFVYRVVFDYS